MLYIKRRIGGDVVITDNNGKELVKFTIAQIEGAQVKICFQFKDCQVIRGEIYDKMQANNQTRLGK